MAEPVLTLSGISKSFAGVQALVDGALELRAGEVTALIGENGAGKSTLVKILTGIYAPDAGTILVDGRAGAPALDAGRPPPRHHGDPSGSGGVRRSFDRREHLRRRTARRRASASSTGGA